MRKLSVFSIMTCCCGPSCQVPVPFGSAPWHCCHGPLPWHRHGTPHGCTAMGLYCTAIWLICSCMALPWASYVWTSRFSQCNEWDFTHDMDCRDDVMGGRMIAQQGQQCHMQCHTRTSKMFSWKCHESHDSRCHQSPYTGVW